MTIFKKNNYSFRKALAILVVPYTIRYKRPSRINYIPFSTDGRKEWLLSRIHFTTLHYVVNTVYQTWGCGVGSYYVDAVTILFPGSHKEVRGRGGNGKRQQAL